MVSIGSISDVQWTCSMGLSDWIQWTMCTITKPSLASEYQFLSNGPVVAIEHHWTSPLYLLDIVSIEHWIHCVHWTSFPLTIVPIRQLLKD